MFGTYFSAKQVSEAWKVANSGEGPSEDHDNLQVKLLKWCWRVETSQDGLGRVSSLYQDARKAGYSSFSLRVFLLKFSIRRVLMYKPKKTKDSKCLLACAPQPLTCLLDRTFRSIRSQRSRTCSCSTGMIFSSLPDFALVIIETRGIND